jgi:hypothetical protein
MNKTTKSDLPRKSYLQIFSIQEQQQEMEDATVTLFSKNLTAHLPSSRTTTKKKKISKQPSFPKILAPIFPVQE